MKILTNNNGTFLLNDESEEAEAMAFYKKNGYEFEDNGTRVLSCGDDYIYDDVEEINYEPDTDTQTVKVSYLSGIGYGRYKTVEQEAKFVDGEMIGYFTDL